MVDTDKLRGIIAERGLSQCRVAAQIGISPRTFYAKMKSKVFDSTEIEAMISLLSIEDPVCIFFTDVVAQKGTERERRHHE